MIVVTIYMCSNCMRVHHSAAECETHEKSAHQHVVDQTPPVLSRLLAATPEPVDDEVEQKAEKIIEAAPATRKDSSSSSSDSSDSDSSDDDVEQRPTAVKRAKVQQQLPQQSVTITMIENETTEEGKVALIRRKIADNERTIAVLRADMAKRHSPTLGEKRRAPEDSHARRSFPAKSKQQRVVQSTAQPTTSQAPAGDVRYYYKCDRCEMAPFKHLREIRKHLRDAHGYRGREGWVHTLTQG